MARVRTAKPKKTFADIAAARLRYSPRAEGYGNVRQWVGSFYHRMGFDEAQRVMGGQKRTPRAILGVGSMAQWPEIRTAYRLAALACHPDRCHVHGLAPEVAEERFKELSAAYTVLAHEFGK